MTRFSDMLDRAVRRRLASGEADAGPGSSPRRGGITRRQFAAGAAVAGAATVALSALSGCSSGGDQGSGAGEPQVVNDDSQAIAVMSDFGTDGTAPEAAATWSLPLGTVLFHTGGVWAAAMQVADSAATGNTAGALSLATGGVTTLLSGPTQGTPYEVFDVRCSDAVFAWVEVNYTDRSWKLIAQPFAEGALSGSPVQLDEGTSDYDPPKFTATGSNVIWQHMPSTSGGATTEHSYCRMWTVGDSEAAQVWDSPGRFATAPRVSGGILTISPRVRADEGTYYGMTALDLGSNNSQVDQLVLPQGVHPLEATYMTDRFGFSIEAEYDSRGLLGKMGTFVGREGGPYLYVSREPLACIAGNGSHYLVKSQASHIYIDSEAQQRATIAAPDRSLTHGDYPASEGVTERFLTYATVRSAETGLPAGVTARLFNI